MVKKLYIPADKLLEIICLVKQKYDLIFYKIKKKTIYAQQQYELEWFLRPAQNMFKNVFLFRPTYVQELQAQKGGM